MRFGDRLGAAVREKGTAAVVGIDPVLERLPRSLRDDISTAEDAARAIAAFGRGVIESVATHVPLVKINIAFFEVFHEYGIAAFYQLVEAARDAGLLVIADIKRGDIGSTAALIRPRAPREHRLARPFRTTNSRRGHAGRLSRSRAVQPFVDVCATTGRGVYVLVRPSDPGADQVHDFGGETERFYEFMGDLVSQWGTELIGENGLSAVSAVVAPRTRPARRACDRACRIRPCSSRATAGRRRGGVSAVFFENAGQCGGKRVALRDLRVRR